MTLSPYTDLHPKGELLTGFTYPQAFMDTVPGYDFGYFAVGHSIVLENAKTREGTQNCLREWSERRHCTLTMAHETVPGRSKQLKARG
jgi:hypothetical protein